MGFVVPQGRERMMGYGRFEDVVNALEGAVPGMWRSTAPPSSSSTTRSNPRRHCHDAAPGGEQLVRPHPLQAIE